MANQTFQINTDGKREYISKISNILPNTNIEDHFQDQDGENSSCFINRNVSMPKSLKRVHIANRELATRSVERIDKRLCEIRVINFRYFYKILEYYDVIYKYFQNTY